MSVLFAIDPGPTESAWVKYRTTDGVVVSMGLDANREIIDSQCWAGCDECAIEMIASYGMPVGASTFQTCVWVGRFAEQYYQHTGAEPRFVDRREVKLHLCHSARANDATVRQALIDRYGGVQGRKGAVGVKATPGPLYGIRKDIWAALGVAITASETIEAAA